MAKEKRKIEFIEGQEKKALPLYTIGIVAELMGTTNQTLRLYEKHGLIKPSRKNKNRYYSDNDIRWLLCLRDLIHDKKISIEGIKKGEISALIAQDPTRMGFQSIKAIVDYIRSNKINATIDIGVSIITKENLNDEDIQKLLSLPSVVE